MRRNIRLALAIFIFVALSLSVIDMARSQLVEDRPGERAAEARFEAGKGEPWRGGNSYIENNPTECPFVRTDRSSKGAGNPLEGRGCPVNGTLDTGDIKLLEGQNLQLGLMPDGKLAILINGSVIGYLTLTV